MDSYSYGVALARVVSIRGAARAAFSRPPAGVDSLLQFPVRRRSAWRMSIMRFTPRGSRRLSVFGVILSAASAAVPGEAPVEPHRTRAVMLTYCEKVIAERVPRPSRVVSLPLWASSTICVVTTTMTVFGPQCRACQQIVGVPVSKIDEQLLLTSRLSKCPRSRG